MPNNSEKGYADGRSGRDYDSNMKNDSVAGRAFDAVVSVITGTDQIGHNDRAAREYSDGYTAGKSDRDSGKK